MLKLQTPVDAGRSRIGISYNDRIMIIGSCFAGNVGKKMSDCGFNVCVNPFGTLYNPVSVCNSINRLECGIPFSAQECVPMGSGAGLICSFSHHTSFARKTEEEFLENANARLSEASEFYHSCNKVIITLGTSWCFKHIEDDQIVSNCLKRDAREFVRLRLSLQSEITLLKLLVQKSATLKQPKQFIFTVSPIRHMKDGAHGNQISKASLLLAEEEICEMFPDQCEYFPAYEIMMDELRDYRFYAEDMVHPSDQSVGYIWERFCDFALPEEERNMLVEKEREFRRSQHIEGLRRHP